MMGDGAFVNADLSGGNPSQMGSWEENTHVVQGQRLRLRLCEGVFKPAHPSIFLAEHMLIRQGDCVCDVGTGTGLYAIVAAKLGASTCYGTDVSNKSIELARVNAKLNSVDDICTFEQGSLLAPVRAKDVNVIVSNPPQTPREIWSPTDICRGLSDALDGGPTGVEIPIELIHESSAFLGVEGRLYILLFEWGRWQDAVRVMENSFGSVRQVARGVFKESDISPSFTYAANQCAQTYLRNGLWATVFEAMHRTA